MFSDLDRVNLQACIQQMIDTSLWGSETIYAPDYQLSFSMYSQSLVIEISEEGCRELGSDSFEYMLGSPCGMCQSPWQANFYQSWSFLSDSVQFIVLSSF